MRGELLWSWLPLCADLQALDIPHLQRFLHFIFPAINVLLSTLVVLLLPTSLPTFLPSSPSSTDGSLGGIVYVGALFGLAFFGAGAALLGVTGA